MTENEVSEILSQNQPSISKNQSRRNSQVHEIEIIKQDVYNFSKLFKQIEVKQAFINEYFIQVPTLIIQTIFLALKTHRDEIKSQGKESEKSVQERLDLIASEEGYELLIAKYA